MKSGTISPSGSDTAIQNAVAPVSTVVLSLAAVVAAIIAGDAVGNKRLILVDFRDRLVLTKTSASGDCVTVETELNGLSGLVQQIELVPADATRISTVWGVNDDQNASLITPLGTVPTRNAFADEVDAQLGFSRPTKSWSGLVGAIEDADLALRARSTPVDAQPALVIDQLANRVMLFEFGTSVIHSFVTYSGVAWTAVFDQTVAASSTGGLFAL